MKLKFVKALACGSLLLFATQFSVAQDNETGASRYTTEPRPVETVDAYRPHIGLVGGIAAPEGSYEATSNWGLELGFQPYIPFSLGAEFSSHTLDNTKSPTSMTRNSLLVRGAYNFSGDNPIIKNSYVGAGIGTHIEDDVSYGGLLGVLGYDYPLAERARNFASVGAQVRYLLTASDNPDVLTLNGSVKYWF